MTVEGDRLGRAREDLRQVLRARWRAIPGAVPTKLDDVTLTVDGVDGVRRLTVPGGARTHARTVTIVVRQLELPTTGWRGHFAPPPGSTSVQLTWPEGRVGRFSVSVETPPGAFVDDLARRTLACVGPGHALSAAISSEVGVAPGVPQGALSHLPGSVARPPGAERAGGPLLANDVVLARWGAAPAAVQSHHVIATSSSGFLGTSARLRISPIDIRTHNPMQRNDGHVGMVTEVALALHGDLLQFVAEQSAVPPPQRLCDPVPAAAVRTLRTIDALDLSLVPAPDTYEGAASLSARLSELAATGVLLHSGSHLGQALDLLPTGVAAQTATVGVPSTPERRRVASVRQRRSALRHGSGIGTLDKLLVERGQPSMLPHVTALLVTNRPEFVDGALRQLRAQSYPRLDVVVVLHGHPAPPISAEYEDMVTDVVSAPAELTLGEALALATQRARGELLTKFDDDDHYSTEHIWDLVTARGYSGATVVGKQPEYTHISSYGVTVQRRFASERYVEAVAGGTLLISKSDLYDVGGWRPVPRSVDRALFQRVLRDSGLVYATHGIGFVYARHISGHTWAASDSQFLRGAVAQWSGFNTDLLA